ncbi:H-NS family nucleoid-associated regulatory protein [Burkholderia cepacia]|uniref:H-NS family nucleoid-associated regulatory protein n=1 Tax=Burkholderia cepacia TaxID=292 RepID=UPI002AB617DE|nr:H-NS family nucleoid-associated regulatory protein [Burkholderia cepacia]
MGITQDDIFQRKGGRTRKRRAVCFDPVTGQTWSGAGREPLWIKGRNRDDFLLKDDSLDKQRERSLQRLSQLIGELPRRPGPG